MLTAKQANKMSQKPSKNIEGASINDALAHIEKKILQAAQMGMRGVINPTHSYSGIITPNMNKRIFAILTRHGYAIDTTNESKVVISW